MWGAQSHPTTERSKEEVTFAERGCTRTGAAYKSGLRSQSWNVESVKEGVDLTQVLRWCNSYRWYGIPLWRARHTDFPALAKTYLSPFLLRDLLYAQISYSSACITYRLAYVYGQTMVFSLTNVNISAPQEEYDDEGENTTEKAGLLRSESYQPPFENPRRRLNYCASVLLFSNICLATLLFVAVHLLQKQYSLLTGPDPPYCKSAKHKLANGNWYRNEAPLREDGVIKYINMKYEPDPEFQSPIVPGKEDPWTSWALGRATGVASLSQPVKLTSFRERQWV